MKNILIILMLIIPGVLIAQTDYYAKDLPEYSAVVNDSTHVMYIDAGGIDKHVEMPTFLQVISDSVRLIVQAMEDSIAGIRAEVAGGGAFSKVGTKVYLTSTNDSLGIGLTDPSYKVDIAGTLHTSGSSYLNRVIFGDGTASGQIWSTGDNLFFTDNAGGWGAEGITLQQLRDGIYNLTSTTYYPPTTNNYNFGGLDATTYKVKITGSLNATGNTFLDGKLLFKGSGGGYDGANPSISITADVMTLVDESGSYTLEELAAGGTGVGVDSAATIGLIGEVLDTVNFGLFVGTGTELDSVVAMVNGQLVTVVGGGVITLDSIKLAGDRDIYLYQDQYGNYVVDMDGKLIYYSYNSTESSIEADQVFTDSIRIEGVWFNKDNIGSGGSGEVDTTGLPVAGQVTLFTAANKIGGDADFTYNTTTGQMYVGNAYYVTGAKTYLNPAVTNNEENIANQLGTNTNFSSNAMIAAVKNNTAMKFYVKNDTSVFVNDLKYRGDLYSWKYRALTDTFGVVMYPGGKYDTASVVMAADGWKDPLEDFDAFYKKSFDLKALPLQYPDGRERRKVNPLYMSYQLERELERNIRYDKELRDRVKVLETEASKSNRKNIRELRARVDELERRLNALEEYVIEQLKK